MKQPNIILRVSPFWYHDFRRTITLCLDQRLHHERMAAHRVKRARECAKVIPAIELPR